jgi:transposase-like protein
MVPLKKEDPPLKKEDPPLKKEEFCLKSRFICQHCNKSILRKNKARHLKLCKKKKYKDTQVTNLSIQTELHNVKNRLEEVITEKNNMEKTLKEETEEVHEMYKEQIKMLMSSLNKPILNPNKSIGP